MIMKLIPNKPMRILEQWDIVSAIKNAAEIFAKDSVLNDIETYAQAVKETEEFDGDRLHYEYEVKLALTMSFRGLFISFNCLVSVFNGMEVDVNNVCINDYIILDK